MSRMREVALEKKVLQLAAVCDEQADRIEELEMLVRDMWQGMCSYEHDCRVCARYDGKDCEYIRRIKALGIEVER